MGYQTGSPDDADAAERPAGTAVGARDRAALTDFGRPLTSRAWRCATSSILPDKRLRLVSEPVKKIDAEVKKLVADMFETMYDAPGIGLAAIQVGVPKRIVTMDLSKKDERQGAARLHQSGNRVVVGREERARGGLPLDPGILRGRRAAGAGAGEVSRPRRQAAGARGERAARHLPAARDRPHSTACCSSTTSPSSSATASPRNSPRRRSARRRVECPSVSSSWARPTSRCRRWRRSSGAATTSPRSIPARRSRPAAAAWSCSRRRSSARRGASGLPVLTPATLRTAEAQEAFRAHKRRRRGGGRLRADPAEAGARCGAARLLQPARLAAAALARRRADPSRDHGGRRRDRRHGDEDGGGARHRPDRHGRARSRSRPTRPPATCTTSWRAAAPT